MLEWEQIDDQHQRCKVAGGWLVKAFENRITWVHDEMREGYEWQVTMCFVPDPKHEWSVN